MPDLDLAPLVELVSVSVHFQTRAGFFRSDTVQAVRDVSLTIAPGETLALVGESGSGKTTVGRVSLRLLEPTAGRVCFAGQDISQTPVAALGWLRKQAQIVFQDPFSSLNPYMRVGDLVEEPLIIDGVPKGDRWSKVASTLEAVEMRPAGRWAGRYPSAMSGGQRQRVGIARALIRGPVYLVADEPVSMIDASSRIGILSLLRRLQHEQGLALLSITHDIASARHFSDRIAVMERGRVVELGPSGTIVDRPLHPYTRALIAAVPEPDPVNRFRRRSVRDADAPPGTPVLLSCPHAAEPEASPLLLPAPDDPTHLVACHR